MNEQSEYFEKGVTKLWVLIKDFLSSKRPKDTHHAAFIFVHYLINNQYEELDILRALLFHSIKDKHLPEDINMRFEVLQSLTENGKDIKCFEEQIGPLILDWMPQIQFGGQIQEFLGMVVNLVKFNAACLDEEVVSGVIKNCCYLCCYSREDQVVLACLQVLEAVVSYAIFPHGALQSFIAALCRTVNVERYCRTSWKIMRNLLGADLGHAALWMMCEILRDSTSDVGVTRGAVFYINMALWGGTRVPTLKATPSSVLPCFLNALDGNQPVVTFEVILALQSLINKHDQELHEPAWNVIFTILTEIIGQVETMQSPNKLIMSHLQETLSTIEQLVEMKKYNGNLSGLYALIDRCSNARPEQSVIKLINYKAASMAPASREWLTQLTQLTERYTRYDTRTIIRMHMLQTLHTILQLNRNGYEEELLDRVVVPIMQHVALDADVTIRAASAKILVDMALHSQSKGYSELLDMLEKQINRPFDLYVNTEGISLPADENISDIRLVVAGLIKVFHSKLFKLTSSHAVKVYLILVKHLELHYAKPSLLQHHPDIRIKSISYVSVRRACKLMLKVVEQERDWCVLQTVLREIPNVMQHKALVLSKHKNDIDLLALALCSLVASDKASWSARVSVSEVNAAALTALASVAPYHAHLEPQTQQKIVKFLLAYGLVLRSPQQAIIALTIFTLETRETMVKMLPEVLLELSKISDTCLIAGPILEFLSTLTRLPKMFVSFVDDQYMSVFAILLPYTNPSRYNHYVVSLAHHVIAAWFLKCRLAYRRSFVRFIVLGLHNYILLPFEEAKLKRGDHHSSNEDSSSRMRSSSLGSRGRETPVRANLATDTRPKTSAAFHLELTETCVDFMARYSFSPCSIKPRRSPIAEFMFLGGQSQTWLIGHKLVTITTSGCMQTSLKNGLCERCSVICKQHTESLPSSPIPGSSSEAKGDHSNDMGRPISPKVISSECDNTQSEQTEPKLENLAKQSTSKSEEQQKGQCWSKIWTAKGTSGTTSASVASVSGGLCTCWCSGWAEVYVRRPTGDVAWVMRMQNQMNFDSMLESPLSDIESILIPSLHSTLNCDRSTSLIDSRNDNYVSDPSSNSLSASSARASSSKEFFNAQSASKVQPSSCKVPNNTQTKKTIITEPIAIPGSLQRQSSSNTTTTEDEIELIPNHEKCKSRHLVRSNSSPEMSSSWKELFHMKETLDSGDETKTNLDENSAAQNNGRSDKEDGNVSQQHQENQQCGQKKACKIAELRVSCQVIPEEILGTTPPHPRLMTHISDSATSVESSTGKPPTSPGRNKSASKFVVDLPPLGRSKRSNTISVMSSMKKKKDGLPRERTVRGGGGGVTPAFVLLQLYHHTDVTTNVGERPMLVSGPQHERTVKNLDLVPSSETYKIGVLYVGPSQQDNDVAILKNEFGSLRYAEFLHDLGTLIALEDADKHGLFLNVDKNGSDGHFCYVWQDDILQVQFHVATLMPNKPTDPNCDDKRQHIGNDYVSIVYNESGAEFGIHTIKGQFNICIVLIEPLEHGINRVSIQCKDDRVQSFLGQPEPKVISDQNLALLARQLALHCTLASLVSCSLKNSKASPYASNSLERLRIIKRLRARLLSEKPSSSSESNSHYASSHNDRTPLMDDFTEYT